MSRILLKSGIGSIKRVPLYISVVSSVQFVTQAGSILIVVPSKNKTQLRIDGYQYYMFDICELYGINV